MHREGVMVNSVKKKSIRPLLSLLATSLPYLSTKSFLPSFCRTLLSKVNGLSQGSVKLIWAVVVVCGALA